MLHIASGFNERILVAWFSSLIWFQLFPSEWVLKARRDSKTPLGLIQSGDAISVARKQTGG